MAAHGESVEPRDPTPLCPPTCSEKYEPDWRFVTLKKGRTTKDHQAYLDEKHSKFKLSDPHVILTAPLEKYTAEKIKTLPKVVQENWTKTGPTYFAKHLSPDDLKIICSDEKNVLSVACVLKAELSIDA
jgi:hypothetical protein